VKTFSLGFRTTVLQPSYDSAKPVPKCALTNA